MSTDSNRLSHETSPYLLQHADNPVHWQPWDDEALAAAREQDKPILLSIGYSACHWCHVMAHESFEDPETAALMNERLVNIKVDREERPDLDKVYQTAFQLMHRRGGGWPLTLVLTPDDLAPFFAGTYLPREPRYGMADFKTVLGQVTDFFHARRDEIDQHASALRDALGQVHAQQAGTGRANPDVIDAAEQALAAQYDSANGGFGAAPKFPRSDALELFLDCADTTLSHYALHSLQCMSNGGLFDQIGGGFCRYSVDASWTIPHFEKMLYDNGALLRLYARAARMTDAGGYGQTAAMTADWLMDAMQSREGGFYSSVDADSGGGEGQYYLWTREQLEALLSADECALVFERFGLDGAPNFEGRWHLNVHADVDTLAARRGETSATVMARLADIRGRLLAVRAERTPPARDEKILTAWNGIAIRGMAAAGRCLDEPRWIDSAMRALDFVRSDLWRDARLFATYKDGRARLNGYLDDYAFMAMACLQLLQARWRTEDLEFARGLVEAMLCHFEDTDGGGFWFTADDHEALLDRPRSFADESMAAGNGMAAQALIELGHLLGEPRYLDAASRTLDAAVAALGHVPEAMCSSLIALRQQLAPRPQVIVRGDHAVLKDWVHALGAQGPPGQPVYAIPDDAGPLSGLLAACQSREGGVAYVCTGTECTAPMTSIEDVLAMLTASAG